MWQNLAMNTVRPDFQNNLPVINSVVSLIKAPGILSKYKTLINSQPNKHRGINKNEMVHSLVAELRCSHLSNTLPGP